MSDGGIVLMCMLVSQGRKGGVEGSVKRICERCWKEVFVAPSGIRMVEEKGAKINCIPCGLGSVEGPENIMGPQPEQLEEIRRQVKRDREIRESN